MPQQSLTFIASIILTLGAAFLVWRWIFDWLHATYRAGEAKLADAERAATFRLGTMDPPRWIQHVVTTLLPLIEGWRSRDQFGARLYLYAVDRKLVRGGLRSDIAPEQFVAVALMAAGAAVALIVPLWILMFGFSLVVTPLILVAGAALGYAVPLFALREQNAQRISIIDKRLPLAIEFMLLAMEAQASFPMALRVYCDQSLDDPLADELRLAARELDLGRTPKEALNDFAERIDSQAVTPFVLALNAGLDLGQPLKEVLQVQSEATRQRRYQSAEEVAKTASTRAIFPLFLVAVAVLILLVGPLLIKVTQNSLF